MTVAMKSESKLKVLFLGVLMAIAFAFMMPSDMTAFAAPNPSPATTSTGENNAIPGVTLGDDGITMTGAGFAKDGNTSAWGQIIAKYRGFIVGISGIAAVTMVVIFIFQFLKLGASAGNPQGRSQALSGLLWSGIAAAGLGAVSLIVGLFYRSIA